MRLFEEVVGAAGFELATLCSQSRCEIQQPSRKSRKSSNDLALFPRLFIAFLAGALERFYAAAEVLRAFFRRM